MNVRRSGCGIDGWIIEGRGAPKRTFCCGASLTVEDVVVPPTTGCCRMGILEARLGACEGTGVWMVGSPYASDAIVLAMISGLISITVAAVGGTLVRWSSERKWSAAGSLGSP